MTAWICTAWKLLFFCYSVRKIMTRPPTKHVSGVDRPWLNYRRDKMCIKHRYIISSPCLKDGNIFQTFWLNFCYLWIFEIFMFSTLPRMSLVHQNICGMTGMCLLRTSVWVFKKCYRCFCELLNTVLLFQYQ